MKLISRDRLIKEFQLMRPFTTDTMIENIITIIEHVPTIESRPKGKWKKEDGSIPLCFECSVCGWIISAGDEEENNYCPHCGAYMRGEEE